jgi:hypothetical protein
MKTRLENLSAFEKAFFTAAFWTADENAPGGVDYRDAGNASELWERLHPVNKKTLLFALHNWKAENASLLEQAGNDEQNGHDLFLTQGGHGSGFFDRGYGETGEKLTAAAHSFGEYTCTIDDEGVFIE